MKIFYQFADGTTSIVEVDNELGDQIKEMERYEDKIQKREQRHCNSYDLDGYNIEKDSSLGYVDAELESIWCGKEDEAQMLEKLKTALPLLKPSHRDVIKAIYFDGLSQTEYAAIKGVNQSTVQRTLKAAEKNLKKFLEKYA